MKKIGVFKECVHKEKTLMNQLTIFSVFHRPYQVPNSDFIKPIQVGRELADIDLGFISDNTGNNISSKNKNFCELTALYWIWNNLSQIDSEFIGLAHYRRYFTLPIRSKNPFRKYLKTNIYYDPLCEETLNKIVSPQLKTALIKNLRDNKVIIPTRYPTIIDDKYNVNVKEHYIYNHIQEDWDLLEKTVLELYPNYKDSFSLFKNAKNTSGFNMFISDKSFINNYCTWLFNILFTLEKKVKICEYPYQSRLFGFMSERLINLFLLHNKLITVEFPVLLIY